MGRSEDLQAFLDAAFAAFGRFADDVRSRNSITKIFALLETPGTERTTPGKRLPVCDQYLPAALDLKSDNAVLKSFVAEFARLEPRLEWKTRPVYDSTASGNFPSGHANAMIVGPGGLEARDDLWLGASLMAPRVRYPDHDHSPEETYLVLTDGAFMQEDHCFVPGVGGSFYNPPAIKHTMLSKETPLLAFWALFARPALTIFRGKRPRLPYATRNHSRCRQLIETGWSQWKRAFRTGSSIPNLQRSGCRCPRSLAIGCTSNRSWRNSDGGRWRRRRPMRC